MNAFVGLLLVPALALALGLWAHHRVHGAFARWGAVPSASGISGAEAARRILRRAGLESVAVRRLDAADGDHYDPRQRQVCLSREVFDRGSVTALAVAAHECGHALQHARGYQPLLWRQAVLPLTRFGASLLPWALLLGVGLRLGGLMLVAVMCHGLVAIVQLITLPVEFDASRRARRILMEMELIQPGEETAGVRSVLDAAALTYVAGLVAVVAQLIDLWLWQRRAR